MKMLSLSDLRAKKGIPFSRQHIHRLIRQCKFPPPVKVGENTNPNFFLAESITH
jgi:prophage regulatory protein